MDHDEETPEERAERRRRTWTMRKVAVDCAMQASETTLEQRVAMLYWLSLIGVELTGRPMPTYPRDQMPGRVIRARQP